MLYLLLCVTSHTYILRRSIGVTAYVLLCGFAPFNAGSEADTYRLVEKGLVQYPSPAWDKISTEARQFVQALLQSNVEQRLSAQQALAQYVVYPTMLHSVLFLLFSFISFFLYLSWWISKKTLHSIVRNSYILFLDLFSSHDTNNDTLTCVDGW